MFWSYPGGTKIDVFSVVDVGPRVLREGEVKRGKKEVIRVRERRLGKVLE